MTSIYDQPEGWIVEYPQFADLADEQMHTFWPWDEPEVENDIQDLRVSATEAEKKSIVDVLRLFTHYELFAGDDYWAGRIMKTFKRPEIQRMASMFSAVEFNSHAPFYNKINELLYLDNEEFYSSWKESPALSNRMSFIGKAVGSKDDLISIGAFSFIEGAVLYSSFAFLKHFQSEKCGKDLMKNICRGVNLSVADENAHAVGGALLYREILKERTSDEIAASMKLMQEIGREVYDHECDIIDIIFSHGDIKGITKQNLKDFVAHRVNLCLSNLDAEKIFDESKLDGFIESWFYENISSVQFHDFFTGNGSEYNINWKENRFGDVWK